MKILLALLFSCFAIVSGYSQGSSVDKGQLLKDLEILSADSMAGRAVGSEGSKKAQAYLLNRFKEIGILPYNEGYTSSFKIDAKTTESKLYGTNIIGYIPGKYSQAIVVTAHYDHIGVDQDQIYNGADDNASGVGALLALATYFKQHKPKYTLIFAALDAEEVGLTGAKAFLNNPPIPLEKIMLNVNMDMLGINDKGELYASGSYHYPKLKELLLKVEKEQDAKLLLGHDRPEEGHDDWTMQSDHFQFHKKNIPYVYFGVEDHPHYHKPSDKFQEINKDFYVGASQLVLEFMKIADNSKLTKLRKSTPHSN